MSVFEKKGWFRCVLPDGWTVDESEEPLSIYRPDGAGALQVTVQAIRPLKPGEKIDVALMLSSFLRSTGVDPDAAPVRRRRGPGLDWAFAEHAGEAPEGGGRALWRVWMATNHDIVAFLTYACAEEDRDRERAEVDRILDSLELL